MTVLLTLVSVLCAWLLLTLLVLALLMIFKVLESVRRHLERIAMGVRAIEQQTAPLGPQVETAASRLDELAAQLRRSADGLGGVDAKLAATGDAVRGWLRW